MASKHMTLPVDDEITIEELTRDPYSIYKRFRATTPVIKLNRIGRVLVTKAADTKLVKETTELFTSEDKTTPMERAFQAHTLMRKDGEHHAAERGAMAPAYSAKSIRDVWMPIYTEIADKWISSLPRGETVDLFPALAGPFAAECLTHLLGITNAHQADMQRWSQILIDGAGNYGWQEALFDASDKANAEMNACFAEMEAYHLANPNPSAFSAMLNADDPIAKSQMYSNIKIAIGGGINEPRDALLTIIYGLLSNPNQFAAVKQDGLWGDAFDEGVRWVAPIQVSVRRAVEDTEIRGVPVAMGEAVMTAQASANHDEEVWRDGHLFDVLRDKHPHQAFGNGPHFCQGKHIARRMIADIMLPMLFDRFPDMKLGQTDNGNFHGFAFRGPISLPVTLN